MRAGLRGRRRAPLALALLLAAAVPMVQWASATTVLALDLDSRLQRSQDVFVGRVVAVRGEALADEAWTVVTIEVDRWLRAGGADVDDPAAALATRPTVELSFLGGDATGVPRLEVAGMPRLSEGERVLAMTYGSGVRYASPVVGFDQGVFRLVDDVWTDPYGDRLEIDDAGVLQLGTEGTPADDDLLDAVVARLVQVGGR
jgi:hypothetical protein